MTLVKHELKQGKTSFLIWMASIGFLLATCIFLFPEMKGQMDGINDIFASMGSFTEAFGMDRLNFGTLIGFYAVECGNILGLGGAFYAAICAVGILSKEEKDRTAEFLLTHPISRVRIITEKLIAVLIQITAMNLMIYALSVGSIATIGEEIPWTEITLLHLAYYLLQIELAGICFGISAFLRKGSVGVGLGIAVMMYFLNLIANIAEVAEFLKYITPFGYCEGADIVSNGRLDGVMVTVGMVLCVVGIASAYLQYTRKDIHMYNPDGILISNGPGNPEDVMSLVELVKKIKGKYPVFGIGLGHQIISLAYGAKTYKLKFGHRGGNHPVRNLVTGKVEITGQNHGYAVDIDSIKGTELEITHVNILDNTVEGVECAKDRVIGIQYQPENTPEPQSSGYIFDKFIGFMKEGKENA